jgi:hypothetical protein
MLAGFFVAFESRHRTTCIPFEKADGKQAAVQAKPAPAAGR